MELTTPLNWLGDVASGGYRAKGGVGVGGADVASGTEDFAHVFGEVEAVGVPGAVFLDGERTGSDRLGGIPRNQPQGGMIGAGEVYTGNLQIATVNEPLVRDDSAIATNDLFEHTAAHEVIIAFHGEEIPLFIHAGEVRRAVCCIIVESPIRRFCLDVELVTVGIEFVREVTKV